MFTFIYRATGLRAVRVLEWGLTDSRGSPLRVAPLSPWGGLPLSYGLIIPQMGSFVNTFFEKIKKFFRCADKIIGSDPAGSPGHRIDRPGRFSGHFTDVKWWSARAL